MHLTGGQYKGRKIITPKGVRPTLSNVRESVFNVLYSYMGDFSEKKFLDLFLGSGIMTLEAVSRGFFATCFEINQDVIKTAKQNLSNLGAQAKIMRADSLKFRFRDEEKFDVIYADPPWDYSYENIILLCQKHLFKDGLAILECDKKKKPDILRELESQKSLELFKEKNYGRCCLLFIRLS